MTTVPIFKLNELPSESECIAILRDIQKERFICKKCNATTSSWKNDRNMLECKNCKSRISITTNTLIERTKIPINSWIFVLQYRLFSKNTSIKDLQKIANFSRYDTIYTLCLKIDTQLKRSCKAVFSKTNEAHLLSIEDLPIDEKTILTFCSVKDKPKKEVAFELSKIYIYWLSLPFISL